MSEPIQSFRELPKMHTTYANVIKSLIPSTDKTIGKDELPKTAFEVASLVIDQENLQDYRKVCGFINDGRVPATYFAVLSQTLQMNMMAKPDFPFAMLGLIHIHNKVTQHRVIYDSEVVRMQVRLDNLQPHDKGQQFDFVTDVFVGDNLVWSGVSTYLSRQKTKRTQPQSPKPTQTTPSFAIAKDGINHAITVAEDIGRRYAFVSGDFNLIHLHPLSARAFGYPKAIAHGMWSKARALALFEKLPDAFSCQVDFKAPIFLPSKVEMLANPTADGYEFGFVSTGKNGERVHLLGTLTAF